MPVPAPAAVQATAEGGRTARRRRGSRPPSRVAAGSRHRPLRTPPRSTPPRRRAPRAARARRPAPSRARKWRRRPRTRSRRHPYPSPAARRPNGSAPTTRRAPQWPAPVARPRAPVPGRCRARTPMLAAAAEVDPARAQGRAATPSCAWCSPTSAGSRACATSTPLVRRSWCGASDGATRLWSSNDCLNNPTTDLRTLVPGRPGRVLADVGRAHHDTGLRAAPDGRSGGFVPPDGPPRRPHQPADPVPAHPVIQGVNAGCRARAPRRRPPAPAGRRA